MSNNLIPCLKEIDSYVSGKEAIGIDISAMPIPVLIQVCHFLMRKHADKKIIMYYTEPGHYSLDNLFDFNAMEGEIEIKTIPGFEGKTAQKTVMKEIIFYMLGFEMDFLNNLISQEIKFDEMVPINGFPSYFPKYKDISLINNNKNYYEEDIQMVFSNANNPFETFNRLSILKNQYSEYSIDIIPAGTKPMALGACLFALKNKNIGIRLLFPFPDEYKNHTSVGSGTLWEYVIN